MKIKNKRWRDMEYHRPQFITQTIIHVHIIIPKDKLETQINPRRKSLQGKPVYVCRVPV